jgi:DNA-binding transcriptional MerR regulator
MDDTDGWTLDQLAAEAAAALADGYAGQPSGRVRDLPDRRAIRYYTTLGLVDRPSGWRGRVALYGRRHLLQLVAIKRLQAQGLTLAEVQARLLGLDDEALRAQAGPVPAGRRFWAEAPRPPAATRARAAPAEAAEADAADHGDAPGNGHGPDTELRGVRLGPAAVLLVEAGRPLGRDDLEALRAAAAPLLRTLRDRGLDGSPTGRDDR